MDAYGLTVRDHQGVRAVSKGGPSEDDGGFDAKLKQIATAKKLVL